GSASCSCSRSTTSRAAWSGGCVSSALARPTSSGPHGDAMACRRLRRSSSRSLGAPFAALLLMASAAALAAAVPWPTAGWEVSTPEAQGVPSSALADLVDFGVANDMDSLLVVRHGRIV